MADIPDRRNPEANVGESTETSIIDKDKEDAYLHYAPAVRFGNTLAVLERYRGKTWAEIEPEARRQWEADHERPWAEFKEVVHQAWEETRPQFLDEAEAQLAHLADLGIDLDAITQQLLAEGVTAFADSYNALIAGIAKKRRRLQAGWRAQSTSLGSYQAVVDDAMTELAGEQIINRIWAHDHTVWHQR